MKKKFRKMVTVIGTLAGVLLLGGWAYLQHPKFGELPEGNALATIKRSPNYVDGAFRNLVDTPMFTQNRSFLSVLVENLRASNEGLTPEDAIPSVKTDLQALNVDQDLVIWLGHSSYYVQLGGKRILIDPVFSEDAAPVPFANRAFAGTNPYSAEDIPSIDYLLITHDHWDHLDYPSITALKSKVGNVVTGLGVGAYFEQWGYDPENVHQHDWNDTLELDDELTLHVLAARHYSGRMLQRNQTLWVGFALETPERRLLFSGDSGYGPHFAEIGQRFDGFDLVALDHGQYDSRWAYIHMTPEEAAQAAEELRAAALLPAHVGKFALARHTWQEPFERIAAASQGREYRLVTPLIGEPLQLAGDALPVVSHWWE
ncbi:MBL fold metallo-hydrolase [Halomonas sp. YLB-10]|uniref:MBL fold metallo-hydrolase n=1 Tax=unclassified Halomonas TaxID=2609666 RepID=UPI000F5E4D1D|nr:MULTISPECIES: MBL fold metallo-hydrolase [unclassified Halomonas]RQW73101.1 MBL fold metallo-hydrolase [Halomonas sp. YLB-10]